MERNGMKSFLLFAMHQTFIWDIETNHCLNCTAEILSDRYVLTASKIPWSETFDIKLNGDCDSNNCESPCGQSQNCPNSNEHG
jgi:hypothetical protein